MGGGPLPGRDPTEATGPGALELFALGAAETGSGQWEGERVTCGSSGA